MGGGGVKKQTFVWYENVKQLKCSEIFKNFQIENNILIFNLFSFKLFKLISLKNRKVYDFYGIISIIFEKSVLDYQLDFIS